MLYFCSRRSFGTHLTNADLAGLGLRWPLTAARYWAGGLRELARRELRAVANFGGHDTWSSLNGGAGTKFKVILQHRSPDWRHVACPGTGAESVPRRQRS
jgi:hypothetical protein